MPPNPLGVKPYHKSLVTLTNFCKQRNIPFNENEQRYYMRARQDISKTTFATVVSNFFNDISLRHNLTTPRYATGSQSPPRTIEVIKEEMHSTPFGDTTITSNGKKSSFIMGS